MHQKLRRLLNAAVPEGVERHRVTDRASWLERRRGMLTASVAGALFGVHEYQTRYGLHMLKAGLTEEDPEDTPAMVRGRLLEPVAVEVLRMDHRDAGWIVEPCGFFYGDPRSRVGATPDAVAWRPDRDGFGNVQIKTVQADVFRRKWVQEDGTVRPPDWITMQSIQEAKMSGASWAAVAPMVVDHGITVPLVELPMHEGIWGRMREEAGAFWEDVAAGRPPEPDFALDGETIEELFAKARVTVDMGGDPGFAELLDEREELAAAAREVRERAGEVRTEILFRMMRAREAVGGEPPMDDSVPVYGIAADGRRVVVSPRSRGAYEVKAATWTEVDVRRPPRWKGRQSFGPA